MNDALFDLWKCSLNIRSNQVKRVERRPCWEEGICNREGGETSGDGGREKMRYYIPFPFIYKAAIINDF